MPTPPRASSFGFRIFRLNVVTVFAVGVALSLLFVRQQSRDAHGSAVARGSTVVRSLASAVEVGAFAGDRAALEPGLRGALSDGDVQYAVVYDAGGNEIGHLTPDGSLEPPEGYQQIPLDQIDGLRARMGLTDGWEDPSRRLETRAEWVLRPPMEGYPTGGADFYFPIVIQAASSGEDAALLGEESGGPAKRQQIGTVRVGLSRASYLAARRRSLSLAVATLAVAMVAATVASLELSRRLAAPLKALAEGARAFGAGNYGRRVSIGTRDEVGELAGDFNRMAENLQDVHRSLEGKVADRTAQLSFEKTRLEAVLNTVDDGVIMLDAEYRFAMVNRRFAEMVGCASETVLGKSVEEFVDMIAAVLADPDAMRERVRFLRGHPQERAVDMLEITAPERRVFHRFSAPVFEEAHDGAHKRQLGRIEVYRDVTRETEVDRMKSEFISTVSHELRTPLTSIKGSLGLILGGVAGELAPEVTDLLSIAQNNSDRLIRLINDILDISKIESGKMKLKLADFDLVDLIREALQGVDGFAVKYGVQVRSEIDRAAMPVNADHDRVLQVLTNLLSNAIKFSPKDSEVVVSAGRDHAGMYRVRVIDQGIGIPADQVGKLFQKFQQVDGTFANQSGGTGLGLAICRALVQEHGGDCWVESELGKGSTFSFTLPAPESTAGAVEVSQIAEVVAATGSVDGTPRILVVDDDRDVANLIRMYLEREGFDCVTAIGGAEALKAVKESRFDAVTLDLNMPGVTGLEVAKTIKEDPATKELPVIFVSVTSAEETEAASVRFADWITKPIDPLRLVGAVKRHAARRVGRPNILVVDDDPDIQKLLGILLSREGFEVEFASNGEDALRRVAARRPELIILDLVMPAMDGFTVVKRLREQRSTRRIPILVLTVKDLSEDEREILQTGATKFLTKSYANRDALLAEVVELLNGALRAVPDPPTGEMPVVSPEVRTAPLRRP